MRRREQGITPARSVRVSDEVWEQARRQAAADGIKLTYFIVTALEGYGQGLITLPTVHKVHHWIENENENEEKTP